MAQIIAISPVILKVPGRIVDMELRVSAPATGNNLPVIILSHGHGMSNFLSSMRGYGPLVDYYAAQGFVVIQPTHLSSKSLNLDPNGPEGPLFWKSRAEDIHTIIDRMDEISDRVDKTRIAAVGHSLGGHTVAMLAGMQVKDPYDGQVVNLEEKRIKAFVMFGTPGIGKDLNGPAGEHYQVLKHTDFSGMEQPVLVVAGDRDAHEFFSDRQSWRADAYHMSPAPKCLFTVFDSHHMYGGISGYDTAEAAMFNDETPAVAAFVQEVTLAYIRTALYPEDAAWEQMKNATHGKGKIECK